MAPSTVYDNMDRGTPAGRLLHTLYGGANINGRSTGERYSRGNSRTRAALAAEGVREAAPAEVEAAAARRRTLERLVKGRKAQSIAPRLGTFKSRYGWIGHDNIPMAQKGRTTVRIVDQKALKAQFERENAPPAPAGPALGPKATQRLQLQMEWARAGKVPDALDPDAPASTYARSRTDAAQKPKQKSKLQEAEELWSTIEDEIKERQKFMAELQQIEPARAAELGPRIDGEISSRYAQLKKVDKMLRELEDEAVRQNALQQQQQQQQPQACGAGVYGSRR